MEVFCIFLALKQNFEERKYSIWHNLLQGIWIWHQFWGKMILNFWPPKGWTIFQVQYDDCSRTSMVLKFLEYIFYIKIKKSGPSSGSLHEIKCILLSVTCMHACTHAHTCTHFAWLRIQVNSISWARFYCQCIFRWYRQYGVGRNKEDGSHYDGAVQVSSPLGGHGFDLDHYNLIHSLFSSNVS